MLVRCCTPLVLVLTATPALVFVHQRRVSPADCSFQQVAGIGAHPCSYSSRRGFHHPAGQWLAPLQGAEKLIISKMLEQHSNRRTFPVDRHAGMAVAGVAADGRSVVSRAMGEVRPRQHACGAPLPGSRRAIAACVGRAPLAMSAHHLRVALLPARPLAGVPFRLSTHALLLVLPTTGTGAETHPQPQALRAKHAAPCLPPPDPEQASQYKSIYGEAIPGHVLAERLGSFMHLFNLYGCAPRLVGRLVGRHGAPVRASQRFQLVVLAPPPLAHPPSHSRMPAVP